MLGISKIWGTSNTVREKENALQSVKCFTIPISVLVKPTLMRYNLLALDSTKNTIQV